MMARNQNSDSIFVEMDYLIKQPVLNKYVLYIAFEIMLITLALKRINNNFQSFEGKSNNITVGYNHLKIISVGDDFSYVVFTDGTQYTAADSEKCSNIHREAHVLVKCPTKGE